jgi:hypothetical protein
VAFSDVNIMLAGNINDREQGLFSASTKEEAGRVWAEERACHCLLKSTHTVVRWDLSSYSARHQGIPHNWSLSLMTIGLVGVLFICV